MNFFHNRIVNPVDGGPTFKDWLIKEGYVKDETAEEQTADKTASEAKPGIGMDTDNEPRGQMRGQVINNDNEEGSHSYQEGESVDGKKEQGGNARSDTGGTTDQKKHEQADKGGSAKAKVKEAECGKEMGESDDAGKVTEEHTEAGPGDDQNPEPKVLINNDPNYQKGESTDPAKAQGKSKKQPGDPVVGKSSSNNSAFKKVASLNREEKIQLFAKLSSSVGKNGNPLNPIEYVESMVGLKFANMTDKEKAWFKDFWNILYPPAYVEEMVADR